MPASNACWGIEVGAGAIKAIKLQRDGDGVKVLDFAIIPHKKVLTTPELDQNDAIRVALGQLVSQKDLTNAAIAISVPGHSSFARFAKLPPVDPRKIPDIVKFEAVQQIPFPIEQVEWDYQTFKTKDNPDVEVGIFAVTRDKILERLTTWNEVGVTPEFVTLGPLAAYNSVAWDQDFNDKTPGTVILDVGASSTDLIVSEPGRVWVRTFPIGGHQFTEALVGAFKLSYVKAEALKRQAEQSTHARHILQAMRPVFGDLAQDVQRSLGYYQSSHKDANLTRLIGLGSTFNLPGLRKYLAQQLQMEVVRLEKFNKITVEGPSGAEFEAGTINLATAYGLALQGLGFDFGIMANLVPVNIVREGVWKKKTKWVAAAAGLSIAAGAVTFLRPLIDKNSTPAKPAVIQQVASTITKLKSEWATVSQGFAPDFRATNIAGLPQHRDIHAKLIHDVGVMLKTADDAAAVAATSGDSKPIDGKPAEPPASLTFTSLASKYTGPGASGASNNASGGPAASPTPGGGRISMVMELKTVRPEADKFLVATVMKWLSDNADRVDMPYTFDKATLKYRLLESTEIKAGAAPGDPRSPDGGASPPPANDETVPTPPPARKGGGRMGGGGDAPPDDRGSAAPPPTVGDPTQRASLDQLAPIPAATPFGKPGQTLSKFRVEFEAVIKDNKPEVKS